MTSGPWWCREQKFILISKPWAEDVSAPGDSAELDATPILLEISQNCPASVSESRLGANAMECPTCRAGGPTAKYLDPRTMTATLRVNVPSLTYRNSRYVPDDHSRAGEQ
ncbi:hypothetical protein B0H63DRAFT_449035 [Podospora didyma]|uniref:Uncharacterized protein n=1 Tax=Podospora didyma TaxID=330526 RepID=A0AAE0TZC9_9PEZI|nr:hypothetical protein B0H63DRAFT_449035 [Podospora didyma]